MQFVNVFLHDYLYIIYHYNAGFIQIFCVMTSASNKIQRCMSIILINGTFGELIVQL